MALDKPTLSDGFVTLRPWRATDLEDIVEICQDAEIVRWTRVPSPYGEADARKALADTSRAAADETSFGFAVVGAGEATVLGSIDVRIVDAGVGDIGYLVRDTARRRGVGAAALKLVSRWSLDALGLARLQITIRPTNVASLRLAEACGYRFEGVLRSYLEIKGERVDAAVYSLLPGEIDRLSGNE
ncbi:MAG: GNAT family N-acetyltransferase [Gaiellaceae bacterium]